MICQYDQLVDKHTGNRRLPSEFISKSFFGQLQHILVVRLPAIPAIAVPEPVVLFLAGIRSCQLEAKNSLNMPYYWSMGSFEVVDMSCVQCLVARIPETESQKRWAIVDRSGYIARSFYANDGID